MTLHNASNSDFPQEIRGRQVDVLDSLDGLDSITLRGIFARGIHGVLESEHHAPQDFSVDLTLWFDSRRAASSDDVADTVDYSVVAEKIVAVIEGKSAALIERLATHIALSVLEDSRIAAVQVTLHKPHACLNVQFEDVAIRILRTRSDFEAHQADFPVNLTQRPDQIRPAVLALGANLGNPLATLREVVAALQSAPEFERVEVSPLARTRPVLQPGAAPQPDYYNAVVRVWSRLSAVELLKLAHHLEDSHGRERPYHWAARTLDVDVIDVEGVVSADSRLVLPHPRAATRAFVLVPWSQLDPQATLEGRTVAKLAAWAQDVDGIVNLWADWLETNLDTESAKPASNLSAAGSSGTPEVSPRSDSPVRDRDSFGLPSWQAALPQTEARPRVVDNDTEIDIIRQQSVAPAASSLSSASPAVPVPEWKRVRRRRH
ncbi:2-amino-4-hydroxy-6-hydroxymethyldihydropteridine diphosphokinase [Mobiluncus curtisii]|uniref:Bifunctional folate synthesis protein n=2 Tax=Mobiluncus curtisii TaxID=2051 RepID=D6ZIY5_MOBCV|nr:2-amino-4-hydroxy-6-hydroxymethyldihydropteridine diphosphokinase [Mobiluncus curtisii]ADI66684.1 2-amino-4-hydroxy-6-hydroxymethyldihydropteridine diphosphokinase [Mobiluncus curtisii ATCC 43063]QQU07835.1 2-amino-4-hydroxy-6-hydroxymethyldihydropteridine diphosphokinase [Mobiluncus curtisii]SQB63547.1 Probable dihydroneopterin aldolase [Mobiluncus curtisii]